LKMKAAPFCAGGPRAWVVPLDSEDSCLGDSGHSDEEHTSKPADESSNATTQRKRRKVAWKPVEQQNSAKEVPVWQDALPDSETIRRPIQYFQDFFEGKLLDKIVEQSNLYYTQQSPNGALRLDRTELEQFLGTVVYMSIFHLPRSRLYWSGASRVQQVADVMSQD
ncbi:unnamed protein product, partial [Tetraodon nigroviridis]